ncbi:hypothetical protein KTE60_05325 [Burkholderia multivorans]|uniref:hypothetical protein n=1 Tax=Burkholderia multivorans TaxID=87883 RepID=UPI001C240126|nr:hypothetical protein [Burkholderia multivorans]MBU9628707.1 hypothetical protein [Burkholderia multivorans]
MSFFTSILLLERQFMRSGRQRRTCASHGSNVAKTRAARIVHLLQIAIRCAAHGRAARRLAVAARLAHRAIPPGRSTRAATIGQSYRVANGVIARIRNERLQI